MNPPEFQLLPEQASTMAPRVDALFWFISLICILFTFLIALSLIYFAVRYRRRSENYFPTPVVGSRVLELTWSGIPLMLTMIIFVWGARLYFDMMTPPTNALEVYVIGKQWMWHAQHPGGQREINALHVPVGRVVKVILTSEDVLHDFFIPAFRIKMDAVPGRYTYAWFEATKPGTYHLFCALYCGTEHARMIGTVTVLEPAEYERWLTGQRADLSMSQRGKQLFQKLQCVTCHHPEAGGRAPILENLYGKRVELENGSKVLADEQYLRESILYPARKVRAGWRPVMPSYAIAGKDKDNPAQISEQEMAQLIAFLRELGPNGTPPRLESATPPEKQVK